MTNALTIDVEEWHDTVLFSARPQNAGNESGLPENIRDILELLERHGTHATFFFLGSVARRYPGTVRAVAEAGHEIACHGDLHRAVCRLTRNEFRRSLVNSRDALLDAAGIMPVGYRAPTFSIFGDRNSRLSDIREAGYLYDSSLYPLPFSGRRREPHAAPCGLMEFPPSVFYRAGAPFPFLGGSFLRLLPAGFVAARLSELNSAGLPGVLYFHSWEFLKKPPDGAGLAALAVQFLNTASVPGKVSFLLDKFRFAPARKVLGI